MAGTKAGGIAAAATNKKKYGADFYRRIGKTGGEHGTGHDFGHGKLDPSETGRKGGYISKRGKTYIGNGQYVDKT